MVDVENDYIAKDGIREDTLEEMTLTFNVDSDDDDDSDSDLIDDEDRHLIDRALHPSSPTETNTDSSSTTNTRRDLAQALQSFNPDSLDSVLPLP